MWPYKFFSKKIPSNPKFGHVKSTLNTGPTVRQVELLTDKQVSKRKSEIFKRITSKKLNSLIAEETNKESVFDLFNQNLDRSNKIGSVVESKIDESPVKNSSLLCNANILLLDIRLDCSYDLFHIKEGLITSDKFSLFPHQPGQVHFWDSSIRSINRKTARTSSSFFTTRMTKAVLTTQVCCFRRDLITFYTFQAGLRILEQNFRNL